MINHWLIYNTYREAFLHRVVAPDTKASSTLELYQDAKWSPAGYRSWEDVERIEVGDLIWFLEATTGKVEGLARASGALERGPHPDYPPCKAAVIRRVTPIGRFKQPFSKERLARIFYKSKPHPGDTRDWIQPNGNFLPSAYCHPLPATVAEAMASELAFTSGSRSARTPMETVLTT